MPSPDEAPRHGSSEPCSASSEEAPNGERDVDAPPGAPATLPPESPAVSSSQPGPRAASSVRVTPALCGALVAALAMGCFANALRGPWILDDVPLIANNAAIHSLSSWREWVLRDFWNVDLAEAQLADRLRYFRPLVLASYALDWWLGAGAPWVLHLTNLVLHGAVALLALHTLRRWTTQLAPACLGALIFALHPTKAESVAWISGRPDLWLTLGIALALWGIARRLRRARGAWALELCGTAIAYLSKEHAIVLPAFAVVEAWVAEGRPPLGPATLGRCSRAALPQLAVALSYLAARAYFLPLRQFEVSGLTPAAHAGLVLETFGRIQLLAFWPQDLTTLQGMIRTGTEGARVDAALAALGGTLLIVTCATVLFLWRRAPALALAGALWLGTLLPVSNLVWSGLANLTSPRFLYLPLLALAWAVAEIVAQTRRLAPRALWGAAALPLVLGCLAAERSGDFRSATAFWNRELAQRADSVDGYLFAVDHERNRGRPHLALQLAARGLEATARDHSHAPARGGLVLRALELAAQLTPDAARRDLAELDTFMTRLMGTERALLRVAGVAMEIPPGALLREKLAHRHPELLLLRADIAVRRGEDARALELAERAVQNCPRCARQWESAAKIALRAGDPGRARAWLAGPRGRPWSSVPAGLRQLVEHVEALDVQRTALSGPQRVQLDFRRYALLGLFGRAHAALAPHASDILQASPSGALLLAEAAARAGAVAEARQRLSTLPRDVVEARLDGWAPPGTRDAPLGPGDDLELEATLRRLLDPHGREREASASAPPTGT